MKKEFLFLTLLIPSILFSHGGGLNKDGCHNDRKTGGYHCHRTKSPSIHDAPQLRTFKASEKSINLRWCDSMEGIAEFRTKDGTYVDCLTESHATETEFGNKWKEAIGQSLHYAESTKKKAGILLIQDKNSQVDYLSQLQRVIEEFQLPITLYVIEK
jgi:hypothetical protein